MSDYCYTCTWNRKTASELPPREAVCDDGVWRVAHAFGTTMPGWLVMVPRRHVLSLSDLTFEEVSGMGPLLRNLSNALEQGFGAIKTYVALFAEAEGYSHLHFHVVPRHDDLPSNRRGPGIFEHLRQPPDQWVSDEERDRVALKLQTLLS